MPRRGRRSTPFRVNQLNSSTQLIVHPRVALGQDITIGRNTSRVEIGYGSFLGDHIYIDVPELTIGDYTTIHNSCALHGYRHIRIGHNCWFGQFCIIDGIGGATFGNNVGVGAHSQLWSHMKFGDMTAGCRWNMARDLIVKDDVWFVGHCIVTPITAEARSMLLVGGVISTDMKENHVYGGVPAKDLTHQFGTQFQEDFGMEQRLGRFLDYLSQYSAQGNDVSFVRIKERPDLPYEPGRHTLFSVADRTYCPNRSEAEYTLMKYLLYEKAKFVPAPVPHP